MAGQDISEQSTAFIPFVGFDFSRTADGQFSQFMECCQYL
jgi:hypothetical protein